MMYFLQIHYYYDYNFQYFKKIFKFCIVRTTFYYEPDLSLKFKININLKLDLKLKKGIVKITIFNSSNINIFDLYFYIEKCIIYIWIG